MIKSKLKELQNICREMRRIILKSSYNSNESTHIGGALSIVEILAVIYNEYIFIKNSNNKNRFILSKGHGFLALASVLNIFKKISDKELSTYQKNGSQLIAHPIANMRMGIESSNGSLGQGLSFAIGIAIANKKSKKKNKVFVLIGDGECYEGAIWEAAITATEQKLDNLILFVDSNGHQNDGKINKIMNTNNLYKKWKGFGWNCININGHNPDEINSAIIKTKRDMPTVIISKTIKGKGVKFMENNNDWHHGMLSKKLLDQALDGLN